ncbi:Elongation factor 1-delta [Tupaia chinensis]|uniref:Elongation factor 1-delta n=1 Tax=Tupaia chinensis TaxID=246437 RepID=L9KP77_TUPCH|nr:Elongation factor 1-delta [Tupaia chinensis]
MEKKSEKPVLVAKSSILLDVKPWDDETDMGQLEVCVCSVQLDGLVWGGSQLVPVGYDIRKLQISVWWRTTRQFTITDVTNTKSRVTKIRAAQFHNDYCH